MFVHSVYFWLKDDRTEEQRAAFREGIDSLKNAPTVRSHFIGTPADTDRPIIDRSYSYALVLVFDDKAGHDAYQVDPVHTAFVDSFDGSWDKVVIYDFE